MEALAFEVLLATAFIDKHLLAILTQRRRAAFQMYTPIANI